MALLIPLSPKEPTAAVAAPTDTDGIATLLGVAKATDRKARWVACLPGPDGSGWWCPFGKPAGDVYNMRAHRAYSRQFSESLLITGPVLYLSPAEMARFQNRASEEK